MSTATTYPDSASRDEIEKLKRDVEGLKLQLGNVGAYDQNALALGTIAQRISSLENEVKQLKQN
jgi:hypothetical protein